MFSGLCERLKGAEANYDPSIYVLHHLQVGFSKTKKIFQQDLRDECHISNLTMIQDIGEILWDYMTSEFGLTFACRRFVCSLACEELSRLGNKCTLSNSDVCTKCMYKLWCLKSLRKCCTGADDSLDIGRKQNSEEYFIKGQ